jgi:16S rRNA processing protein RimM
LAIRRNKPASRGPNVAVPRSTSPTAPGGASFAAKVKRRRKKAAGAGNQGPPASPTGRGRPNQPKPSKKPRLLSREDRIAIASGRAAAATASEPPEQSVEPAATPPSPVSGAKATPASPQTPAARPRPKEQAEPDPGFVAVGRILAPFGLKGEVKVLSLTENPDRFRPKARLYAGPQPVTVEASREASGHLYVKLKGFPDRGSVEKFRLTLLQVPESDLPELAEGEYYRFQLVGLNVEDRTGAPLGVLEEVLETGANDVYRVGTPGGTDLLLAATPDVIVSVDLAEKRMVVDPPEWT